MDRFYKVILILVFLIFPKYSLAEINRIAGADSFKDCSRKLGEIVVCPEGTYRFESSQLGNMINGTNKVLKAPAKSDQKPGETDRHLQLSVPR